MFVTYASGNVLASQLLHEEHFDRWRSDILIRGLRHFTFKQSQSFLSATSQCHTHYIFHLLTMAFYEALTQVLMGFIERNSLFISLLLFWWHYYDFLRGRQVVLFSLPSFLYSLYLVSFMPYIVAYIFHFDTYTLTFFLFLLSLLSNFFTYPLTYFSLQESFLIFISNNISFIFFMIYYLILLLFTAYLHASHKFLALSILTIYSFLLYISVVSGIPSPNTH